MLEDKLLLDMKPAPPKEVGEAKKVLSGGRLFRGRCKWEESEYVFEVATEPPAKAAKSSGHLGRLDGGGEAMEQ